MKKRILLRVLHLVVVALWIAFIFSNSMRNGDESSSQSGSVVEFIKKLLGGMNISELFIRKMGHFSEYFILGGLMSLSLFLYDTKLKVDGRVKPAKVVKLVGLSILGLIIAVIDENIQRFSPGRSCSVVDMIIDFSGYLLAFYAVFMIKLLCKRKIKERQSE